MIKFESFRRLLNVYLLHNFIILGNKWITGLGLRNFYKNACKLFIRLKQNYLSYEIKSLGFLEILEVYDWSHFAERWYEHSPFKTLQQSRSSTLSSQIYERRQNVFLTIVYKLFHQCESKHALELCCMLRINYAPETFLSSQSGVKVTSHSNQRRVRVTYNFFLSSQNRVMTWSSRVRKNYLVTSSHWFKSLSQGRNKSNFTFFLWQW